MYLYMLALVVSLHGAVHCLYLYHYVVYFMYFSWRKYYLNLVTWLALLSPRLTLDYSVFSLDSILSSLFYSVVGNEL